MNFEVLFVVGSTYRAKKETARHACETGNGNKIIGPIQSHPDS